MSGRPAAAGGPAVNSPCVNICTMEEGYCAGCLRSLAEIVGWADAGNDEKRLILAAVAQRRSRLQGR